MAGKENPEVVARADLIIGVLRATAAPIELTDLREALSKLGSPSTDREADKALQYLRRHKLVEFQKRHPPISTEKHAQTDPVLRERGWILTREGKKGR